MNNTTNNDIPSLTGAEFIKMNSVIFLKELPKQIILALICAGIVLLPTPLVAVVAVVLFCTCWFAGQHYGQKVIKELGIEMAEMLIDAIVNQYRKVLVGYAMAFAVLVAPMIMTFGGHAALAFGVANFCIVAFGVVFLMEVGSAVEQEEELEKLKTEKE